MPLSQGKCPAGGLVGQWASVEHSGLGGTLSLPVGGPGSLSLGCQKGRPGVAHAVLSHSAATWATPPGQKFAGCSASREDTAKVDAAWRVRRCSESGIPLECALGPSPYL